MHLCNGELLRIYLAQPLARLLWGPDMRSPTDLRLLLFALSFFVH